MAEADLVCGELIVERARQEDKWGQQDHDDGVWALILGEEFGEACQAALGESGKGGDANTATRTREELIQVAAVAISWIQAIDRRTA